MEQTGKESGLHFANNSESASPSSSFARKLVRYSAHPPRFYFSTTTPMSSPNGKIDKMEVDRPRSLDRRSKSYVVPLPFAVLYWTLP